MRSTLLTLTVLALIGGVGAQWWWYHEAYGPDLALRARDALKDNGVTEASVRLDYLDATLLGWAADEATRTRALDAIHLIRGLRVAEKGDQIHIQQRLESRDEPGQVILSGWLALPQSRDNLLTWLTALRPDLTFKADDLHVSPRHLPGGIPRTSDPGKSARRPAFGSTESAGQLANRPRSERLPRQRLPAG